MKMTKKARRFLIRLLLFIGVYIGIVRNLLIQHNVLTSVIYLVLSVVVLLFLVIDFTIFQKKHLRIGIGTLMLLGGIIFLLTVEINLNTILAYILLNLAFVVLMYGKDFISFNAWKYFTGGGYLFSFFIALAYSFFIVGTRSEYAVNCEQAYGSINAITEKIEDKKKSETGNQSSKKNTVAIPKEERKLTTPLTPKKKKNLRGRFLDSSEEVLNDVGVSMQGVRNSGNEILVEVKDVGHDMLDSTKSLRNNINDNRKALSVSACKYLGTQISYLYQNTYFQLAVIGLLSLVFVGVIRFVFWIVTMFAYTLFKILYLLGVYKTKKVEKLVDTVD